MKEFVKGRVSVVLLCYNNAEFLTESIESILNQDYPDIELIIADDASTDNSEEIILSYSKKDSRVIPVIQKVNLGMAANQNAGLSFVTGEFLIPHSGDDVSLPGRISRQVEYLRDNPKCGLVVSMTEAFDNNTGEILYTKMPLKHAEHWLFVTKFFFERNVKGGSHNNTTIMARSEYYLSQPWDKRFKYKAEVMHAIDLYCSSPHTEWHGIDEVLTKYRVHNTSATQNSKLLSMISEETWMIFAIQQVRYPEFFNKIQKKHAYFLSGQSFERQKKLKAFIPLYYRLQIAIQRVWTKVIG